jgi:hypothetical protein
MSTTNEEINVQVAEKVFGWKHHPANEQQEGDPPFWKIPEGDPNYVICGTDDWVPDFAGDIAQAWRVAEKMRELGFLPEMICGEKNWRFTFAKVGNWRPGYSPSAPLAICLAALAAIA